jgi:1-acyl-sn-glycerol-3-phosphate acyltransferase
MRPGLLYRFLKLYVRFGFNFFFRRYQIHNQQKVPLQGPVIFAINHQNAFMDALVVAVSSKRNPWFITRASVFASATARFWLTKLQMLPIYRFRDGHANMKKNDEAMEHTRQLLHQNETILIFPEGNHDRHWSLRPLQKGIARMAFDLEKESDFNAGLTIVPVGLQYENHLRSWSDLLVNFGDPIHIKDYQSLYEKQAAVAMNTLVADLKTAMKRLIIHIEPNENYDEIAQAVKNRSNREKDLYQRLTSDRLYIENMSLIQIQAITQPKPSNKMFCKAGWLLFLPAIILHFPVVMIIKWLVNKVVKDDHWTHSIKYATMIFLAPLLYFAEALLLWFITQSPLVLIGFGLLVPVTAFICISFRAECLRNSKEIF